MGLGFNNESNLFNPYKFSSFEMESGDIIGRTAIYALFLLESEDVGLVHGYL